MIKKIFFSVQYFLTSFYKRGFFAAESGGMPQLNPEFWVSQIFWLTLNIWYFVYNFIKNYITKNKCKFRIKKISNTRKY